MTETTLRRKAAGLYGIGEAPAERYYAFMWPDDLAASIYSAEGEWLSDRGSIAFAGGEGPALENAVLIRTDTNEAVGDGSLVWRSDVAELTTWDVVGDVLHTHAAALGDFVSAPLFASGWVIWLEFPTAGAANAVTLWVRRAWADFTNVATIATINATTALEIVEFDGTTRSALTPSRVLFSAFYLDGIGGEVDGTIIVACNHNGASPEHVVTGSAEVGEPTRHLGLVIGLPDPGTDVLGASGGLKKMDDDIDDTAAEARWPTTGNWALNSISSFSLSATALTAILVGIDPSTSDRTLVEAVSSATGGEPDERITIADHPEHGSAPDLLFLME